MTENDLKRIYDSIDDLDNQYKKLAESIATLKVTTDSVSIDNRAINTSIHNLSLSLGALKEKTDAIVTSLKMLAEAKDERIDSAMRESGSRIADFRSLCDSRVSNTDLKIANVKTYVDSEVAKIRLEMGVIARDIEDINKTLDEFKKKINYGVYTLILNMGAALIWIIKLYGASKGWF